MLIFIFILDNNAESSFVVCTLSSWYECGYSQPEETPFWYAWWDNNDRGEIQEIRVTIPTGDGDAPTNGEMVNDDAIETVSPEGTFCDKVQVPSSADDMELN